MNKISLPKPHPEALALSNKLVEQLVADIDKNGPMPFDRYMHEVLYAPQLGYYRNGLVKFGESGDFVTAPEISPLFAYALANQCAKVLSTIDGGDILEFGPGRGCLCADLLKALEAQNQLPAHYYLLEVSASLRQVQKEAIKARVPHLLDRVVWLDDFPKTPIFGVILGNEVLDAMPVQLFTWRKDGPHLHSVSVVGGQLTDVVNPTPDDQLAAIFAERELSFEAEYTSEFNPFLSGWMNSLSATLTRGLVLLIDYGFPEREYYHPDRCQGTLMCHYQHHAHPDPLFYPGIQDVTAHVDFTAVAIAADAAGFSVSGFTNQASFLINCGLVSMLDLSLSVNDRFAQNQAVMRLTSPSEMGELFKVIGLTKEYDEALIGFSTMDQLSRL